MIKPTGILCIQHGGDYAGPDAFWYCDECARSGIKPCECGGKARYFGEALMGSVSCESCKQSLMDVGSNINIVERWNNGERGYR